MHIRVSPILLAAVLPLGACAMYPGQDVLGGVLGSVLNRGMGGQSFQDAAVEACTNEARRYGAVRVGDVRAQSSSTFRVTGTVDTNGFDRRQFGCSYREDGTITDFDLD